MTDRDAFDDFAEALAKSWRGLSWEAFDPRNYTFDWRRTGLFLIYWGVFYGLARLVAWLFGWEWS